MKRRNFGLMAASSAIALGAGLGGPRRASAAVAAAQADMLKTVLTPIGGERAGNADGSIPAWTGGLTQPPAGWTPDLPMPDLFANDTKILSIDASNMAQYADRLSEGVMAMMSKYPGFRIDVYPTHRTAAAPQWVYDNIYQNALNAQPEAGGARFGFTGAYGGVPFPIPNTSDPYEAGAEIVWNHCSRWVCEHFIYRPAVYLMSSGQLTLTAEYKLSAIYDYYQKSGSLASYSGWFYRTDYFGVAPPADAGEEIVSYQSTNPYSLPNVGWQLLNGQGRVRRNPDLQYDVPNSQTQGTINLDESFLVYGALNEFDWKLVGKKELYVPYNNNKINNITRADCGPNFINPDLIRWELHRVWIVEATLHPGQRNVIPHRRFYFDEDTWNACVSDEWDAQGNFWKASMGFQINRPDLPGTIFWNYVIYNLQSQNYVHELGFDVDAAPESRVIDFITVPSGNLFNPQAMAAQAQY
jgi:hypothetical protein